MFNNHSLRSILMLVLISVAHLSAWSEVTMPRIFSDNMVLQRDKPMVVWGWAEPGEEVMVSLSWNTATTTADDYGKWTATLGAMEAGGPYILAVNGTNSLEFENVLIGDVWVCSGQSNMQWNIAQTGFEETDIEFLDLNMVRMFNVEIDWDCLPRDDFKGGQWHNLGEDNILFFSAVAYHFGKALHKDLDVPIGLINSSLGASYIEAWMSNEALMEFDQFKPDIEPVLQHGMNFNDMQVAFEAMEQEWKEQHYWKGPGIDGEWHKPETDISDWGELHAPGTWDGYGLAGHDGAVWFRKEFDLPDGYEAESFLLQLMQIKDYDATWVNGQLVGETYGRLTHRNYWIDTDILKPEGNVIVVRAFNVDSTGGFTTNAFWGNPILLGAWKFKKGLSIDVSKFPKVVMPSVSPFSSPSVMFNANIAPILNYPITGAIWYQGEANTSRAYEYRDLLPALIKGWRMQWQQGDFPFLIVQLANFQQPDISPSESDWAELREAQTMALLLPNTGLACAIDIGETNDIHPRDKESVGKRLSLEALSKHYNKDILSMGPVPSSYEFGDNEITIEYENSGTGLKTRSGGTAVGGFAIAAESGKFVWARANIASANTVVIEVPEGMIATDLRYAWGNNPLQANLYNSAGLPAYPFRTDKRPGITKHSIYNYKEDRF